MRTTRLSSPALLQLGHPELPQTRGRASSPSYSSILPTVPSVAHSPHLSPPHMPSSPSTRVSFTVLPTFPSAAACKRLGQLSPLLNPCGWLTSYFTMRASSTVQPRRGTGATLPSAATREGQGQLTCSHDPEASSPYY